MKRMVRGLFAGAICMLVAMPAAAQQTAALDDAAKKAILKPLDLMFDGMKARDTLMIQSAFVPGARLVDIRVANGATAVNFLPVADFARSLLGAPAGQALIERYWDAKIEVEDNVAHVWVQYDFHIGERFSHCGIDSFQLAKTTDGWKIVQVMDTRRRTNCGKPPAN